MKKLTEIVKKTRNKVREMKERAEDIIICYLVERYERKMWKDFMRVYGQNGR